MLGILGGFVSCCFGTNTANGNLADVTTSETRRQKAAAEDYSSQSCLKHVLACMYIGYFVPLCRACFGEMLSSIMMKEGIFA